MKTYRLLTIVLSIVVVWLAYLLLSSRKRASENSMGAQQTNVVEMWRTNTVAQWRTNTVEVVRTNTVLQSITNEVVKEVPMKPTTREREAATVGYKFLNAPVVAAPSETLYKASPLAVDIYVQESATNLLAQDTEAVRKGIEDTLRSRNIQVAEKSPYHLRLDVRGSWITDVPRVALLMFSLELAENVAVQRQSDLLKCPGVVWSTTTSRLVRTFDVAEGVKNSLQDQLDKF